MSLSSCLKRIREKSFYTQGEMAQELNLAISTVNRWKTGKARPSISAMKSIKEFCKKHGYDFSEIESEWLADGEEE